MTENQTSAVDPPSPDVWPAGARIASIAGSVRWLALLFAILMLLTYFWRVGYLPVLSFADLGLVLAAFGLFVLVVAAAALLLMLFPVYSIHRWVVGGLMPAPPRYRPSTPTQRRVSLSRRPLPIVEDEASAAKRRSFSIRIAPGAFGMFWLASTVAAALIFAALYIGMQLSAAWHGMPILSLLCCGFALDLWTLVWIEFGVSARALRAMRRAPAQFVLMLALYLCLWPIWWVLLVEFGAWPASPVGWLAFGFFTLFIVPFVHWLLYVSIRATGRTPMKVRVVICVMLLAYTGLAQPLIDGAASAFGFGMMKRVDLVVDAQGCAIVQAALPGQTCSPLPTPAGAGEAERLYRLQNVDVLTRIGAHVVIAPAGGIDDRTLPRVALPSTHVQALVRRIERKT